ncbi:MAG TPA: M23 family metallopeptidase [Thermodesulfobacteriota bacterium]
MTRENLKIHLFKFECTVPKFLNIKLYHIKIMLITFFGLTLVSLLSFIIAYKFYKKAEISTHQKRELADQLKSQSNVLNEMSKDELVLKSRLIEIEKKLLEMQELLDRKGIKRELAVGGEYIPADGLDLSYLDNMEKDIYEMFNTIKSFPLGKPIIKSDVRSGFGYRMDPFRAAPAFHSGIDFEAKPRQPVFATADGLVTNAGWYYSYGNTVIINHENGYQTLYGHLTKVDVDEGQRVKSGDLIGNAGSTGRSTGTHLHYEIIKNGKKLNPSKYLSLK